MNKIIIALASASVLAVAATSAMARPVIALTIGGDSHARYYHHHRVHMDGQRHYYVSSHHRHYY